MVKTSKETPHSSLSIRELIEEIFDPAYVACVPGEDIAARDVLNPRYDHIFFTGSQRVGALVMEAAARHLTPVTLELGGKSPCIVHHDARLDIAVRRIVYGKFMNAGQTCAAPDFALVHENVQERFLEKVRDRIHAVYGPDPSLSPDYGRMVNDKHFSRVVGLIDQSKVVAGGDAREDERYIAPTVMQDVSLEDEVMKEEIFGPVLPVMTYRTFDDVSGVAARMPQHPLACYLFSEDRDVQRELLSRLQFGGGCVNHCIQHLANPNLPFGGVGRSGIGHYHGLAGFKRFSHQRSILKAGTWLDPPLIYPPYQGRLKWIRRILK
jgi:aldehyde dehydrogenase (NAD+)